MKSVSLLIHEDIYSSSIGGVIDLLAGANPMAGGSGKASGFRAGAGR